MASKKLSAKRKRRGITVVKPSDATRNGWRIRFLDPEVQYRNGRKTGIKKFRFETIPAELTTVTERETWCAQKAEWLAQRLRDLALNAVSESRTAISVAVDTYFEDCPDLAPRTEEDYRTAAAAFVAWCGRNGIKSCDDITLEELMNYASHVRRAPKLRVSVGGERGQREPTAGRRSAVTTNTTLRKLGTVLRHLIVKRRRFAHLSVGDVDLAFEPAETPKEQIEILRAPALRKLLDAALRHDAATFTETKFEHGGIGRKTLGTTPKYDALAPFVVCVLLSGMRLGEAIRLKWDQVRFEQNDIHLEGRTVKTRTYRDVDLCVSPALRRLLEALHERRGKSSSVFGLTEGLVEAGARRLRDEYAAPEAFTHQTLRRSCASFLTNAPGIFGGASAARSALQLGHSISVAQAAYIGLVKDISPEARTLEAAMQIEDLVEKVIARVSEPAESAKVVRLPRRAGGIARPGHG